jgi:PAS domain S-box-containing protein
MSFSRGNSYLHYHLMTSESYTSFQVPEEGYTALFNALPGNCYLLQNNAPHFTILAATPGILNLSGSTREDLVGKSLFEAFPSNPQDANDTGESNLRASLSHVIRYKAAHQLPTQRYDVMDEKGEFIVRYWKAENLPVFDANGEVACIIHSTEDITSQVKSKEIKEQLRGLEESEHDLRSLVKQIEESEKRLYNIVNQINAGIAQATTHGKFTDANERFCQLTGYTKEELLEQTVKDITHPDDWPRNEELVAKALREGKNFFIEKRYIRKDGSIVWVNNSVSIVTDSNGEKFVTAVSVDITDQITNRQKLEESEERFRSMADASPVMIWTLDAQGNSTYYNRRAAEFTGHNEEALREGKSWQVAIHPDDIEFAGGVVRNAVINHIPYEMECRMQRADGEWRWLINHGTPRFGGKGEYFGFVGSSMDITEHKKNQQELQNALEQVRLSKEAAELGTFDMDLEKGTMHWDDRCRTLFGISHHDTVTYEKDFVGGLHPDDRERITKVIDNLFIKSISNGDYDVEYRTVGVEDGVVRWVRAKGKVYFNESDQPLRFIGSVLDITEKVSDLQKIEALVEERTKELANANETLQQINKELQRSNSNLEEFAHAASHDLKEPVRKIHYFANQLKDQLSTHLGEAEVRSFNRIENAIQRMGNLIDDLLLYSHVSHRPHETESINLNQKVQGVLEDLELDIQEKKADIQVEQLPMVNGYRRQLQQLFQNLISNALKYSKRDVPPRITISASRVIENEKAYHLIAVKDNGIGFNQEYAEKIFQMFTRLHGKGEYSGTGVGLSIAKKVVDNHHGFIKAKSQPGEGSTFEIYLPV